MCGRFTQAMSWKKLQSLYQMPGQAPLNLQPRWNGAPTQDFAACRLNVQGARVLTKLRWGLIPAGAPDMKIGSRLINARSETVHVLPAFRAAFRRRRCIIPADGWFEWLAEGDGKQPWFIAAASGEPVSLAGLWERWEKGAEPVESFTILTTSATTALTDIHHRQPSILEPGDFDEWLAPHTQTERLLALARNAYEGPYKPWRVSKRVNSSRNEGPDLVQPLDG